MRTLNCVTAFALGGVPFAELLRLTMMAELDESIVRPIPSTIRSIDPIRYSADFTKHIPTVMSRLSEIINQVNVNSSDPKEVSVSIELFDSGSIKLPAHIDDVGYTLMMPLSKTGKFEYNVLTMTVDQFVIYGYDSGVPHNLFDADVVLMVSF